MIEEHGTLRGGRWHTETGVPRCAPCRRAAADARAASRKASYLRGSRPRLVDSCGVHRRLRALQAIGWSATAIAAELEVGRSAVNKLKHAQRSTPETVATISALYDRLSMIPGPHRQAARYAAAHGWAPPLAWDDDSIDDPAARPRRGNADALVFDEVAVARAACGDRVALRPVERAEVIRQLAAGGMSYAAIAEQLGITKRAVERVREGQRARAAVPTPTATAA